MTLRFTAPPVRAFAGLAIKANIIDNGVISDNAGTMTIAGSLAGAGVVQIGRDGTLAMNGDVAAGATIDFSGAQAALSIGFTKSNTSVYDGYPNQYTHTTIDVTDTIAGLVEGYAASDVISVGVPVTTATYTAGRGGAPGTLTLLDGLTQVAALALTGNFAGVNFQVTPTASTSEYSNGGAIISFLAAGTAALTGVIAANASIDAGQAAIASVEVSDTAANVAANLDSLESVAVAGKLSGIVLTVSGATALTVTAAQQANDVSALPVGWIFQVTAARLSVGRGTAR